MTPIIIYAAKTIVCSCAFILLYMWQFHKKVHYKYCRIYLMATMLLSVVIPAMNVPIYPNQALQAQSEVQYVGDASANESETTVIRKETVSYSEPSVFVATTTAADTKAAATVKKTDWNTIGLIIYLSFIAVTIILTIRSLLRIWRLRTESELIAKQDYSIARNDNVKTPFTFFKTIFVGNNYTEDEWQQIISHEASHARHLHSVERMAMTLLRTVFWFNPFMWIAAKRLEEVQEWQADNDAIGDGYAIEQYRLTILHQIFGYTPDLSLGMSNSFTKNRFIMMTQKLNRKCTRPAVLAAAVAAGAFFAFGCTTQTFARNGQTLDSETVASNNGDTMTFTREIPPYNSDTFPNIGLTFYPDRFICDTENEVVNNRYRSVIVGEKSIETVEYYRDGRKVCFVVANGVSEVRNPQSSELDWVNEKTSIFFEDQLIPFADFERFRKNNAKATIHYLHLNSDMDFVYVYGSGWSYSRMKLRLYHPQSTFCKKLPDVVPVADFYSYGRDFVGLQLIGAKTNEISVLVVPNYADVFCIYDNFVSIGRFKSLPSLYLKKVNPNITLYRNAAAKKRFGNEYDYVVEARPTYPVTEVDDLQFGTKLSEASFTVSKNNTKTFRELLSYGGTYYIQVGAKNPSSSGQVIAALTSSWGYYLGEIKRLKSDQSEIIIFRCDEMDYYNIEINSENGDEVDGTYTLWRKNE